MIKLKTQLISGKTKLDKSLFNTPKKYLPSKPTSGLWSSTYTPNEKYKSSWLEWCHYENYLTKNASQGILFDFKPNINVFEIDSHDDLLHFISLVGYCTDKNVPRVLHLQLMHTINFEEASKMFDVIHLTDKGQIETRMTNVNLYGWDCESCLILNFDAVDLNSQRQIIIAWFKKRY